MTTSYSILEQLPAADAPLVRFPSDGADFSKQGMVVSFTTADGTWHGHFARGAEGLEEVHDFPQAGKVLVLAGGRLWSVNPEKRTAEKLGDDVCRILPVRMPTGYLFTVDGTAVAMVDKGGLRWRTRRLSWKGFDQLGIQSKGLRGHGLNERKNRWQVFDIHLSSGTSTGGAYEEIDGDEEQRLHRVNADVNPAKPPRAIFGMRGLALIGVLGGAFPMLLALILSLRAIHRKDLARNVVPWLLLAIGIDFLSLFFGLEEFAVFRCLNGIAAKFLFDRVLYRQASSAHQGNPPEHSYLYAFLFPVVVGVVWLAFLEVLFFFLFGEGLFFGT